MRFWGVQDMAEETNERLSGLFITGVVSVFLFSILTGYLNFGVFYLFGTPIIGLLVGITLVWTGRAKLRTKVVVSVAPIPLIVTVFFFSYYIHKAEPETFLIPNDLRGEIVVFYDEPCGQSPVYRDGRRVYEISPDGVLITQFRKNRGYLDQKFFLSDPERGETEIPYFHRQNYETERKEWSLSHSRLVEDFTKETVGVFWNSSETYGISRNSFSFNISNFQYFERDEKDRWIESKRFAKLAEKQLAECRDFKR